MWKIEIAGRGLESQKSSFLIPCHFQLVVWKIEIAGRGLESQKSTFFYERTCSYNLTENLFQEKRKDFTLVMNPNTIIGFIGA